MRLSTFLFIGVCLIPVRAGLVGINILDTGPAHDRLSDELRGPASGDTPA